MMVSRVQVLVAAMHQTDSTLLEKMNIQTDAIIGNQCDTNSIRTENFRGHTIKWLNFAERGVGLNRNNALMRADADIVLFADDDMTYVDGYEAIVLDVFNRNPEADIVVFNINEKIRRRSVTTKEQFTKKSFYGAARIAARRDRLMKKGVFFNLCFGGGTQYSHGEDSIFVSECQKKGLRVLLSPQAIATLLDDRASTWFKGYTDQYYKDSGALYAASNVALPYFRMAKSAVRQAQKNKELTAKHIFKLYLEGYRQFIQKESNE